MRTNMAEHPRATFTPRFIDLTSAEQLLLRGLRHCVQAFKDGSGAQGVTHHGFKTASAPEADPELAAE